MAGGPSSSVLAGCADVARQGWMAENRAAAQRLRACMALLEECEQQELSSADDWRPGYAVVDPFDTATGYVVQAMALSGRRAESMLTFAMDVHLRYPAILEAMGQGRMDQSAAQLLARQMATVADHVVAVVQHEVVADYLASIESGERLGNRAVKARVDQIIAAHDADGIRERSRAAAEQRGMHISKGSDGMATIWAHLATEEAAVLAEAIDARVAEHRAAEAEAAASATSAAPQTEQSTADASTDESFYSLAERRADALMSLVCGDLSPHSGDGATPTPLRPTVTVIAPTGDAGAADAFGCAGADGASGPEAGPGVDVPGGTRVEFARTGPAALQALLDMLATSDGATLERVDPTVGAADTSAGARRYRPSAALARRIRLRDGTCRHPGCAVPAEYCDLDHVTPFDHADPTRGGTTTECGLAALCRRHHRFKTFSDWQYALDPDGSLTITTPDGRRMVTRPSGPLATYRRERARSESAAWKRQQNRNPDPSTTSDSQAAEPTYWARRAARLNTERSRAARPRRAGVSLDSSRWWQRNRPATPTTDSSRIEEQLRALFDQPPF